MIQNGIPDEDRLKILGAGSAIGHCLLIHGKRAQWKEGARRFSCSAEGSKDDDIVLFTTSCFHVQRTSSFPGATVTLY
jgi:hypothetical protein